MTITRKGVASTTPAGDCRVFLPVLASGQHKSASVCAAGGFLPAHTTQGRRESREFNRLDGGWIPYSVDAHP